MKQRYMRRNRKREKREHGTESIYEGSAEIREEIRRMSVRKGTKGKRKLQGKAYCRMSVCGPCDVRRFRIEVARSVTISKVTFSTRTCLVIWISSVRK